MKSPLDLRSGRPKIAENVPIALKASTLAIAVLILYFQDLSMVTIDALNNEAASHILIIPLIFIYLLYRKRKMVTVAAADETKNPLEKTNQIHKAIGLLLCVTATILYWYGSYTFTPLEYHILTLPIFTAGLTIILFNMQTLRQLVFPIVFLFLLTPPPSIILYGLGSTLSVIGAEASYGMVNTLGIPSTLSSEYGNPTITITRPDQTQTSFTVDIACSGIYSLISFLVFVSFIAFITRDKTWKKAAIVLAGLPLVFALNILRITTILLIGYYQGEELALQGFHLMGGWVLIFLGTLILIAVAEKVFKAQIFSRRHPLKGCTKCNPNPRITKESFCPSCGRLLKHPKIRFLKGDVGKMAAVGAVIILLFAIQAPVFAIMEGPSQILIQTPEGEQGNTQILPQIAEYSVQFLYRDVEFEQEAKQDLALMYSYSVAGKPTIFVAVEIASTRMSLHRWEDCLIIWPSTHGYQPQVTALDQRDVEIHENPPIIARYFAFEYNKWSQTQVVLYWFETSRFTIQNAIQQKQVKISLLTYPDSSEDIAFYEESMLPFAVAITDHWQPVKTWTLMTMMVSKNGLTLATFSASATAALAVLITVEQFNRKKTNRVVIKGLSEPDQQLIKAINNAEEGKMVTASEIATAYGTTTGKAIPTEEIIEMLSKAERTGLVERQIANHEDAPVQVWKNSA